MSDFCPREFFLMSAKYDDVPAEARASFWQIKSDQLFAKEKAGRRIVPKFQKIEFQHIRTKNLSLLSSVLYNMSGLFPP
jgi:hypothetical protein